MFRRLLSLVVLVGAMLLPGDARADAVSFGPFDIETVFFIDKSDDHNRVDYGIRLNDHCAPVSDDAVFPYWRELEQNPVRLHTLGFFEWVPYGFSEQRLLHRSLGGGEQFVKLKQLARPIVVQTRKDANGRCSAIAHAQVGGVDGAVIVSVYAHIKGSNSVDWVDVHGRDPRTGAALVERIMK